MRVAVQTQRPPVSYVDTKGNRTGFAVELVQIMADDIGVKLKLLDYDWKGLIPAVTSGKADFLAADMTPKATRALVLNFTQPYMYSRNVIYSKKSASFVNWQALASRGSRSPWFRAAATSACSRLSARWRRSTNSPAAVPPLLKRLRLAGPMPGSMMKLRRKAI